MMDVDQIIASVGRFVEIAHESMHILLWEPYFVGHGEYPITKESFSNLSLSFEGFCFWYTDIVLTKQLRERFTDGEFILHRNAVSQPGFHPYRAFKAIGISHPTDILEIYANIFSGNKNTPIYKNRKKLFVGDLLSRFGNFYLSTMQPISLLYKELKTMKFFSEFRSRFCVVGLPSLLPQEILSHNWQNDPSGYCKRIYTHGLKTIHRLSQSDLKRIQLRRKIQTRAYHAYTLLSALERDRVISTDETHFSRFKLMDHIRDYINELENGLKILLDSKSNAKVNSAILFADSNYQKKICNYSEKHSLWMSGREFILPSLSKKFNHFGKILETPSISLQEINTLTKHALRLSNRYLEQILTKRTDNQDDVRVRLKVAKLIQSVPTKKDQTSGREYSKWRSAFNSLVLDQRFIQLWSIPINGCSPLYNKFRDLNFVYE
jgi:hypothetical protein